LMTALVEMLHADVGRRGKRQTEQRVAQLGAQGQADQRAGIRRGLEIAGEAGDEVGLGGLCKIEPQITAAHVMSGLDMTCPGVTGAGMTGLCMACLGDEHARQQEHETRMSHVRSTPCAVRHRAESAEFGIRAGVVHPLWILVRAWTLATDAPGAYLR